MNDAILSDCGRYRYLLTREVAAPLCSLDTVCCFVMLNPSTADATQDDPTIRRCLGFAGREGCGGLSVVNLYGLRATNPRDLWAADDPVGPDNDHHLEEACAGADLVICAWGANAKADRVREAMELLPDGAQCLGRTKAGAPRHPLYLPKDAALESI